MKEQEKTHQTSPQILAASEEEEEEEEEEA